MKVFKVIIQALTPFRFSPNSPTFAATRTNTGTSTRTATPSRTNTPANTLTNTPVNTFTQTVTFVSALTITPTITPSGEIGITAVILYPCPIQKTTDGLNMYFTFTGRPEKVTVRIYTASFRCVKEKIITTGLSYPVSETTQHRASTIDIPT